ncbi:N-acetylglucosaminyl-diphospho-decaprenol L-rhamnosyltransferase [bacterium BMS3Abin15]|nr:N-acetylglucosaminyl-diphospho-decaprenol L-rhamnosyltransferase [bacterium BMS3Abin15]HDH07640.1 glycosyltransferase family 2 protein [Candidatus Moranbacteria bacterium]
MELSIAINNYKNPELLKLCIDSIKKNVKNVEYEIIVTDSATEEDTETMMREDYPEIKFSPHKKNVGFQVLLNRGIKESKGEYILLINGDIIVTENSVEIIRDFVKNNPSIGIAGPRLLNFNELLQYSCFRYYEPITIIYRRTPLGKLGFAKNHLDWFLMKDYDHKSSKEVDWLMGSAFMVSREAIKKVGPMDSRFFMYMEDVDWCRRFWENGYKVVYCPESKMYHYHGKASAKGGFLRSLFSNKLTWIHISSAIKYFWKYRGKPTPRHN